MRHPSKFNVIAKVLHSDFHAREDVENRIRNGSDFRIKPTYYDHQLLLSGFFSISIGLIPSTWDQLDQNIEKWVKISSLVFTQLWSKLDS